MKTNRLIAKIDLPLPIDKHFDYSIPKKFLSKISIGMRVLVKFNNRKITGYVTGLAKRSKIKKLNSIINLVDEGPIITPEILQLSKKVSNHFVASLGQVLETATPYQLRKIKNRAYGSYCKNRISRENNIEANIFARYSSFASIKDYLVNEMTQKIKNKRKVLFLVPNVETLNDISRDMIDSIECKIGIFHGRLSRKEMLDLLNDITNNRIDILIGTRSSIYAPISNIGLIIVFDENNHSYKSDQVPYYHAREVAVLRSRISRCKLIFTSIEPSSETYKMINDKKLLVKNVNSQTFTPAVCFKNNNYKDRINPVVEKEIGESLLAKKKILIFLNRKGFSTYIYCRKCKLALSCERCSAPLRYEFTGKILVCPHCSYQAKAVEICPKCESSYVKYSGFGIEKLESSLQRNFPQSKIALLEDVLKNELKIEDYDIIISTRLLFRMKNYFPDETIVWSLDTMLNTNNYRSCEDLFIMISKIINMTKHKVTICTGLDSKFYLIRSLKSQNMHEFFESELETRKELKLPPFFYNALVSIRSLKKNNTEKAASRFYALFRAIKSRKIEVSKPFSPARNRIRSKYYKNILIKSKNIELLSSKIKHVLMLSHSGSTIITININPI